VAIVRFRDNKPRVVVTGMGIITPIGESLSEYRDSLLTGRSGITRWKTMDERILSKIGGDMTGFDVRDHLARVGGDYPPELVQRTLRQLRLTTLSGRMTAAAALQAFVDAGLPDCVSPSDVGRNGFRCERFGHMLGGHNLNTDYMYENVLTLLEEPEFIDPLYGLMMLDTDVLSLTSALLGCKGPSMTMGGACSTGNMALLTGLDMLRAGRADTMLVTAAPVGLDPVILQGWSIMDAIAIRSFNDDPARASRPWDVRREGFVPSHGSGAVVLESLVSARARGAHIYAELLGGASTSDASRLPKPDAEGQSRAMGLALQDAEVPADRVNYINAHATSTTLGDTVEAEAIKMTFGSHASRIPVNATKSMVGHCLTAAGLVELVATIVQMEHGFLHPTINLDEPEPGLDLDLVPDEARPYDIDVAISNSFGFGGLNTSIVVGRVA
jgi:3-oxoacyl-(acyl-carrier-protein) synthase